MRIEFTAGGTTIGLAEISLRKANLAHLSALAWAQNLSMPATA
ncbi:hypothetical protein CPter91_2059 [Collimonas pratensis]|uniref:Uncharacterized protein n=1 Tax=Collimonas pratensis TaxID=279113 RepID=A0A127Q306_9BURK|nr:hypothetical protein CPter91_2059 [Collimonas pratensis]